MSRASEELEIRVLGLFDLDDDEIEQAGAELLALVEHVEVDSFVGQTLLWLACRAGDELARREYVRFEIQAVCEGWKRWPFDPPSDDLDDDEVGD